MKTSMATAATTSEPDSNVSPTKPFGKSKVILAGGVVLCLLVITGGLWVSGLLPSWRGSSAHSKNHPAASLPTLVDVPDIVTNLDNGSHRDVFIKLRARIEVSSKADGSVITANMPRVLDAFQTYLRSMRPEEIHGGEGTYRLREALMNRIDIIAAPVCISNILFVEMLIQ